MTFCNIPGRDDSLELQILTGIFTGLAILFVSLRVVTRVRPFKVAFGWDDGLIISTTVIFMILI